MNIGITTMFRSYSDLLRTPRAKGFVVAGFVGRIPISMRTLAALLLVLAKYHSYALAGAVSSVVALSTAAAAPFLGRLADRRTQSEVILTTLVVHASGIVALVLLAQFKAPLWTLFVAAIVFGATALPLGSLVRARWAVLVAGTPKLPVAYAFEAFNDDVIYISGPVIATMLATNLAPSAGLLAILGFVTVGWTALAFQRSTQPRSTRRQDAADQVAIREPGMRALLLVVFLLGGWLGSSNVAMIKFADEHGNKGLGGVLIGLMVFGGMVAGLMYGGTTWRSGLVPRLFATSSLLCLGTVPLVFVASLWPMAVLAVVSGLAITPMLVTMYTLLSNLVSKTAVTEGFAWIASSITVGSSSGTAAAGFLVDRTSSRGGFLFMLGCAFLAPVATVVNRSLLGRTPHATPAAAEPVAAPAEGGVVSAAAEDVTNR